MWRLSKLDIRGFKSFAEPAELVFPEGITAVVGPNGCGKSNISDAIVWALGEQSTSVLRAQRMNDVIFQGTSRRRPTGVAEVTLHLTATEAVSGNGAKDGALFPRDEIEAREQEELAITRRLYRSGASEYLLNGRKALLRQVREKLLGTGLGTRACFTIEQGRIDQILSASPLERRAPIEEAAGISLYRRRRHGTNLKLEATAQDLARVEDICTEVARQMRSLKRQAGKARRYRELRDRLRGLERRWYSARLVEAEVSMAVSRAAVQATGLGEESARDALQEATTAWEAARRASREQRQREAAQRQDLYNAQVETERGRSDAAREQDRARFAKERRTELEASGEGLQQRVEDAEAVVAVRREAAARGDEAARASERVQQAALELLDPFQRLEPDGDADNEASTLELRPLAAGIEVKREYRGALVAALGNRLRLPVLAAEHVAAWLEAVTERRGRSRALRPPGLGRDAVKAPASEVLGAVRDVVSAADPVVAGVLDSLLCNTWLVSDRDEAMRLAGEHPEHAFVDPAGSVLAAGADLVVRTETTAVDVLTESARGGMRLQLKQDAKSAPGPSLPSEEHEAASLAFERADAALRAARAQALAAARELQAAETVLRQHRGDVERHSRAIATLDKSARDAIAKTAAAEKRAQESEARSKALEADLGAIDRADISEEAELAGLEASVAAARQAVERTQVRRSSAEIEAAEQRVARRLLHEQIRERLDVEPWELLRDASAASDETSDEHPASPAETEDLPSGSGLHREIKEVRGAIDRLGPVNLVAYDDFQKQEGRFHDLDGQRRDLVKAAENLRDAIRRIDADCVTRFAEAFAAIDGYFNRIMRQMFGGGRAGMRLENPDDPLNSGIEIVAQPPGKSLQSIRLLSGGERSMIALALMFAIFEYHPAPFCILDEADAALDDRNVGRLAQALNDFQDRAQFIMITHNKRSMEIADLLYGVTMEESGVSKLVSVALS